jgi:mevalonate kinase
VTSLPAAPGDAAAPGPGLRAATASAPAKVILFGEHAVNRGVAALATVVGLRVRCTVALRDDGRVLLRSGAAEHDEDAEELRAFRRDLDAARAADDAPALAAAAAGDFFAPSRYVLGALSERLGLRGLSASWEQPLPVGRGLGSGAAANSALVVAAAAAAGSPLAGSEVAALAWEGDVVAHGGVASGLDASACALGGIVSYGVGRGGRPLQGAPALTLVVADTGATGTTAAVNAEVRRRLAARPALQWLFGAMGSVSGQASEALGAGDLEAVGRLMNVNQLLLEQLGVSSPAIERLVGAALDAGALGAKLSGSGGGGIVVALTTPAGARAVAEGLTAAGGDVVAAGPAGADGARLELPPTQHAHDHRSSA